MLEKSYWNGDGKYQAESDAIGALVPNQGKSDNKYVNLFRCMSNVYYDMYNNGGFNLAYARKAQARVVNRFAARRDLNWEWIIPFMEEDDDGDSDYGWNKDESWMGPLEQITDAVIEFAYKKLVNTGVILPIEGTKNVIP